MPYAQFAQDAELLYYLVIAIGLLSFIFMLVVGASLISISNQLKRLADLECQKRQQSYGNTPGNNRDTN